MENMRAQGSWAFGVHVGFSHRRSALRSTLPGSRKRQEALRDPIWDFIMAHEKLADVSEAKRVNLVSANFVPDLFQFSDPASRFWDITTIGTISSVKRWPEALTALKAAFRRRPSLRVLAIATSADPSRHEWLAQQASALRAYPGFSLVPAWEQPGEKGLSSDLIARALKRTKVFTLFSRREGASKVISEAAIAGCRIVVNEKLIRQSLTFPNAGHVQPFSTTRSAVNVLLSAVDAAPGYSPNVEVLAAWYGERASLRNLEHRLSQILLQPVEIDVPRNLRLRLPCHTRDGVHWSTQADESSTTSDMATADHFASFLSYLDAVQRQFDD